MKCRSNACARDGGCALHGEEAPAEGEATGGEGAEERSFDAEEGLDDGGFVVSKGVEHRGEDVASDRVASDRVTGDGVGGAGG